MYERAPNRSVFAIDESETYSGPDRRHYQRRNNPDRRINVRFELDKEPRRSGLGRRQGESVWDKNSGFFDH